VPLLDLFWTMAMLACWVLWFTLLVRVYGDLFSRSDIGGWAKTAWTLCTLSLPFLGVFIYLITQGPQMAERAPGRRRDAGDDHIPPVASDAEAERRAQARDLVESGAITSEEYQKLVPSGHR
jgi:Phospholipase_D-nuclease N-terminal